MAETGHHHPKVELLSKEVIEVVWDHNQDESAEGFVEKSERELWNG
ncbi:MAG: hypothetical protein ACE5KV_05865 [Thermoplasmata archaeon]